MLWCAVNMSIEEWFEFYSLSYILENSLNLTSSDFIEWTFKRMEISKLFGF